MYSNFYVSAPYVREEPFKLFYIAHGVDATQNITLHWGDIEPTPRAVFATAQNLDELRGHIKSLLADERILRFIGNLTILSKRAKAEGSIRVEADEDAETMKDQA